MIAEVQARPNYPHAVTAWLELHRALVEHEDIIQSTAVGRGQSAACAVALLVLADGPRKISALATALSLTAQTLTDLADRLERRGLIARVRTPTDRRVVNLVLTPAGERAACALTEALS